MRRENNVLYFRPSEEKRFLHALNLYCIFKKHSREERKKIINHERSHIEKVKELGHSNQIRNYYIGNRVCGILYEHEIEPLEDAVLISLAPKEPSIQDIVNTSYRIGSALNVLGRCFLGKSLKEHKELLLKDFKEKYKK